MARNSGEECDSGNDIGFGGARGANRHKPRHHYETLPVAVAAVDYGSAPGASTVYGSRGIDEPVS